jgi:hypothetical protein
MRQRGRTERQTARGGGAIAPLMRAVRRCREYVAWIAARLCHVIANDQGELRRRIDPSYRVVQQASGCTVGRARGKGGGWFICRRGERPIWLGRKRRNGSQRSDAADARKDHEARDEKASAHLVGEVSWSASRGDVAVQPRRPWRVNAPRSEPSGVAAGPRIAGGRRHPTLRRCPRTPRGRSRSHAM